MNILYLTSLFPCWSEAFILNEIIEVEKTDIDVTILSLKQPYEKTVHGNAKIYRKKTIYPSGLFEVLKDNILFFLKNKKDYLSILKKILQNDSGFVAKIKEIVTLFITVNFYRKVKLKEISHIHAHWATYPALSAMILSRLSGIPFSFTAHAHDIYLDKVMLREKIESAKRVLTISDFNKKYLIGLYGEAAEEKVSVVRCGIDVNTFNLNGFPERNGQVKTIIAVGRLCDIKGFEYLVEAIHILTDKTGNRNLRCVIVGEGENKNRLAKLINRLKLNDYIELPGAFSQEELQKLLKEGDVFVLPSIVTDNGNKDGIPVVLMEAMATGIPVVTTDVSGLPEIAMHIKTALVVPQKDAQSLAEAIERMLRDKELALQLRENARKFVEKHYNIRTNALELMKIFS